MKNIILILLVILNTSCAQNKTTQSNKKVESHQSSIPWTFLADRSGKKFRGGTTTGTSVKYSTQLVPSWKKLQSEAKLTKFEKDRLAILSLAGDYQATFEFLETNSYKNDRQLDPPYASWGTEMVRVVQNQKDFISLQHIIVMEFLDPKSGKVQGPFVMKHWRQDWHFQGKEYVEYQGQNLWQLISTKKNQMQGKWTWHIYQVDDSPRYGGVGQWVHLNGISQFKAENLKRPLPRRERTLRNDYDLLYGEDTILLSENGWHHEQRNLKLKQAKIQTSSILAREIGLNKYRRITGFPFDKGDEYWNQTKNYWMTVSKVWNKLFQSQRKIKMKSLYGKSPLFAKHFQAAEESHLTNKEQKELKELEMKITKLIQSYIQ